MLETKNSSIKRRMEIVMDIVLFAIIGAHLNVGAWYWICYGLFCLFRVINAVKGAEE